MQYEHIELQPIETCTHAWNERSRCIGSVGRERAVVEPEPPARDADAAGAEPLAEVRDRAGPERDVDGRVELEDPLALRLGVAAADGDHAVGILALARRRLAEVRGELRVRLLADRARVEDDDVGVVGGRRLPESELLEHALDPLGVVGVHLAAERRDVVAPHGRHRVPPAEERCLAPGARGRRVLGGVDPVAAVLELVRGDVDRPALADHRHLDLARVLEVVLDLARDLVREQHRAVVVDLAAA